MLFIIKANAAKGAKGDGVWRTINGSPVFIQGGRITKGPARLVGSPAKDEKPDKSVDPSPKETVSVNYTKNKPRKANSASTITSREVTSKSSLQVKPTKSTNAPATEAQKQAIVSKSQKFVKPMVDSFLNGALKNANPTYKSQVKAEAEGLCRVAARRGASVVNVHPEGKSLVLTFSDGTQRRAGSNTSDPFSNKFM